MKLPVSILGAVRGPVVAAALVGCAGGDPVTIEPERDLAAPEVAAPARPIDPVAYDERLEAERVRSAELSIGADAARRSRRIAVNVARALVAPRVPINRPSGGSHTRCGRG